MNEHGICFILCVSDELYKEECLTYLNALEVPDGYTIDILTIEGAASMCAGYNAGMKASDAKYKIYLHQDVFIRYPRFLYEILRIFEDLSVGMIGMVGAEHLSKDGCMWNGQRVGAFPGVEEMVRKKEIADFEVLQDGIRDVSVVDGLLIATQADLPWREDLFDGWDFYDISQSMEFHRAGYRVVVTAQKPDAWYLHDTVTMGLGRYDHYRRIFLKEYAAEVFGEKPKTRILYPMTASIRSWDIPYALQLLGIEPLLADLPCESSSDAVEDVDRLSRLIRELHADAVMTHDLHPFAARACAENDIPCIAWIWDAPQDVLYQDSIRLPGNYIFDFDKKQAGETAARGAFYVRHMPLAGNVHRMEQLEITPEDERRFSCGISFIGTLYGGADWEFAKEKLSGTVRQKLDALVSQAAGRWDGSDRITGVLTDEELELIDATMEEHPYIRSVMGQRVYIEQVKLARCIAHRERVEMLKRLRRFDVRLYTWDAEREAAERETGIPAEGSLKYLTETPKAYYLSAINLNITLPSIRSGVPLRVFEIMAAGGFVLTNYQPELEELFRIGEEIEVYRSFDELEDKAVYYLSHERERLTITLGGYKKVRDRYSYEQQTARILSEVSADLIQRGKQGLL